MPTPEHQNRWGQYVDDPVGFGVDVLGESFTPDLEKILLSVRDNVVTIAKSSNAVGKTFTAARCAVWFYSVWTDAQVYTTAAPPLDNLQRLLWGEIGHILNHHPALFEGQRQRTLHVERSPRSFLTGVAIPASGTAAQREAKFAGKHAPHLLFIVDEGDAVPPEVYKGIESCMSGGHARLLIMFNPRAQVGPVWLKERNRQAHVVELSALNHPNVKEGRDVIPGAVTRETVVRRINQWSVPLVGGKPDSECFAIPDFLVGIVAHDQQGHSYPPLPGGHRRVTDPALWYMVLGRYPAAGTNQLISRAWVDKARSRWDAYRAEHGLHPPAGVAAVQGQDVAEYGLDANVACFRHGGWVAPLVSWSGLDVVTTGDRAALEYQNRRARVAFVDGTGVGAGVWPQMRRRGCQAHRVMVADKPTIAVEQGEFAQVRDQLWWMVREWLRTDQAAMLPPDEQLIEELLAPTYAHNNKGKIKVTSKDALRVALKRSPDRADALCLTFVEEARLQGGAHARGVI